MAGPIQVSFEPRAFRIEDKAEEKTGGFFVFVLYSVELRV
jgi:hypothetical protein